MLEILTVLSKQFHLVSRKIWIQILLAASRLVIGLKISRELVKKKTNIKKPKSFTHASVHFVP